MVDSVVDGFLKENQAEVLVSEVNILESSELTEKYSEEIPVLKINGETHGYWRIDSDRLLTALEKTFLGL